MGCWEKKEERLVQKGSLKIKRAQQRRRESGGLSPIPILGELWRCWGSNSAVKISLSRIGCCPPILLIQLTIVRMINKWLESSSFRLGRLPSSSSAAAAASPASDDLNEGNGQRRQVPLSVSLSLSWPCRCARVLLSTLDRNNEPYKQVDGSEATHHSYPNQPHTHTHTRASAQSYVFSLYNYLMYISNDDGGGGGPV